MNKIPILSPEGQTVAELNNIKDVWLTEEINGVYMFSFTSLLDDKTNHISFVNHVMIEGQRFDIVKIARRRGGAPRYEVECDHVSYSLNTQENYTEEFENTPKGIADALVSGTAFTIREMDFSDVVYFRPGKKSIRKCLIELANYIGAEIRWDNYSIDFLKRRGADKGLEFAIGENLKDLSFVTDMSEGTPDYSLEVDAVDLAHLPEYADLIEELHTVGLGDDIRVVDEMLHVDIKQRAVKYEHDPFQKALPKVSIGNVIRDITDYLRDEEEKKEEEQEIQEVVASFSGSGSFSASFDTDGREKITTVFQVGEIDVLSVDGADVTDILKDGGAEIYPEAKTPENRKRSKIEIPTEALGEYFVKFKIDQSNYTNLDFNKSGILEFEAQDAIALLEISDDNGLLEAYGVKISFGAPVTELIPEGYFIEYGRLPLTSLMTFGFRENKGYEEVVSVTYGLNGETGYSSPVTVVFKDVIEEGRVVGLLGASNWAELPDVPALEVSIQAICKQAAEERLVEE